MIVPMDRPDPNGTDELDALARQYYDEAMTSVRDLIDSGVEAGCSFFLYEPSGESQEEASDNFATTRQST